MNFKGIIFDLDGTLADTGGDLANAINLMLGSFGFEKKTNEEILKHINFGARAFVNGCLPGEIKNAPDYEKFLDDALNRYMKFYEAHCFETTYLYDGIAECILSLRKHKLKMCVLSNKRDNMTKKITGALLNQDYFIEILGATERFPHKPEPDSALYLADKMGFAPEEIVFIGDSDIDMITAANAGMFALGVTWGYRAESVLVNAGAKKTVHNPGEILDFILN